MINAIIFDFDDTLADTMPARAAATQAVFNEVGIHTITGDQFLRRFRGVPLVESMAALEREHGVDHMLARYRTAYWLDTNRLLKLYDGILDLLEHLSDLRLPMGVVTSKSRDFEWAGRQVGVRYELEHLGIAHFFQHVLGFDDVAQPKPHPEGILKLLGRLSTAPEHTIVVGDSLADISAARAAGCRSCLAGWGIPSHEREPELLEADLVAEEPNMLLKLFS